MDGRRLKFVDGLRGVAAVMVMLYHQVGRTSAGELTQRGHLGVAIFFVLSGFVITAVVGTRSQPPDRPAAGPIGFAYPAMPGVHRNVLYDTRTSSASLSNSAERAVFRA